MKKIIIITFISLGCSLSDKTERESECNIPLAAYQVHPAVNMQISLPSTWSIVDTVMHGWHKHLVRTRMIFNSDSTSNFYLYVTDVKNDYKRDTDTNTLKLRLRSIAASNYMDKDSIISVRAKVIKGWNTVFQKTIKKGNHSWHGGQIISALDSKDVQIIFETNSRDSVEAARIIDCIMASFTISD